jgi:hypothetical protein
MLRGIGVGAREFKLRHIIGVPIVVIGSQPIVGFNKAKTYKSLEIQK